MSVLQPWRHVALSRLLKGSKVATDIRCILPPLGSLEAAPKKCALSHLRNAEE
jgi:hypothetical protein